jgi:excisionase family DNA binding protein
MPDDVLAAELAAVDALPPYLTRAEACEFLRISEDKLDAALDSGELGRRRIGRRVLIPRGSVRAWVLQQATTDASESSGEATVTPIVRGTQTSTKGR